MTLRYFKGRLDFDKLTLADAARVAEALSTLESLAKAKLIQFQTGKSRNAGAVRQNCQTSIIDVLDDSDHPIGFHQIRAATNIKEDTLARHLTLLLRNGTLKRETRRRPGSHGRSMRGCFFYELVDK